MIIFDNNYCLLQTHTDCLILSCYMLPVYGLSELMYSCTDSIHKPRYSSNLHLIITPWGSIIYIFLAQLSYPFSSLCHILMMLNVTTKGTCANSMSSHDYIFNISFPLAYEAVHK